MPKKKKVKKKAKIKLKKVILKKKTSSNDKKPASANPDEKPIITKIKKQASEKKVYNVKDFVVYPKHGVGKIVAVEKAKIGQIDINKKTNPNNKPKLFSEDFLLITFFFNY